MFRIFVLLKRIVFSRHYGVGDSLPDGLKMSELDSLDVYKAKQLLELLEYIKE